MRACLIFLPEVAFLHPLSHPSPPKVTFITLPKVTFSLSRHALSSRSRFTLHYTGCWPLQYSGTLIHSWLSTVMYDKIPLSEFSKHCIVCVRWAIKTLIIADGNIDIVIRFQIYWVPYHKHCRKNNASRHSSLSCQRYLREVRRYLLSLLFEKGNLLFFRKIQFKRMQWCIFSLITQYVSCKLFYVTLSDK